MKIYLLFSPSSTGFESIKDHLQNYRNIRIIDGKEYLIKFFLKKWDEEEFYYQVLSQTKYNISEELFEVLLKTFYIYCYHKSPNEAILFCNFERKDFETVFYNFKF